MPLRDTTSCGLRLCCVQKFESESGHLTTTLLYSRSIIVARRDRGESLSRKGSLWRIQAIYRRVRVPIGNEVKDHDEWTGGATTPHPSMLRLIRIAAVLRPVAAATASETDSDSDFAALQSSLSHWHHGLWSLESVLSPLSRSR